MKKGFPRGQASAAGGERQGDRVEGGLRVVPCVWDPLGAACTRSKAAKRLKILRSLTAKQRSKSTLRSPTSTTAANPTTNSCDLRCRRSETLDRGPQHTDTELAWRPPVHITWRLSRSSARKLFPPNSSTKLWTRNPLSTAMCARSTTA